ncbi:MULTISPECIES: non-oxidative hydroxyarylic acid decarboxylases subunit D [Streptomonospora]|uniref:Non-oxidative hydroxyarylic acid decarboxylases subunit D n=2 Tax=Streptomonospora TaxID=104204 RepID=A0ABV9SPN5_9ACTN
MTCPRCGDSTCAVIASSPVPGVWDVGLCPVCHYTWRSSEPPRQSDPGAFAEEFRLTAEDVGAAVELPPVPPRRADRG